MVWRLDNMDRYPLTKLEQSTNYGESKHEPKTGEYALMFEDVKEIAFILEGGMTRTQVGSEEDELFKLVQNMIIGIPMIKALHDWSNETYVYNEYDENGNLKIK